MTLIRTSRCRVTLDRPWVQQVPTAGRAHHPMSAGGTQMSDRAGLSLFDKRQDPEASVKEAPPQQRASTAPQPQKQPAQAAAPAKEPQPAARPATPSAQRPGAPAGPSFPISRRGYDT